MWSHYAEEHKGFVLEFKIPTSGYMGDELIANEHLFPPIEIPTVQYITQQRTTIWLL